MELGSLIGIIGGAIIIIVGMLLACTDPSEVITFIDPPSIMITFGGTFAALLTSYPISHFLAGLKSMGLIFKVPHNDPASAIKDIIDLANLARREGILALEEKASNMEDEFLKKGVMLIVDGTDPELVRSILETELTYIEARHGSIRGFWNDMAAIGPGWGMIGTIIGLVLMLLNLDPETIGTKMAVALITTFYGSVLANFVAVPVSNKLKFFSSDEILIKEVLIEGMLSIQAGENPRIIEEKLKSFFPPSLRKNMDTEEGGGA